MKIVVDMNLSPAWIPVLQSAGHEAVHWSTVGDPCANDEIIVRWARHHQCVIFTHDLDFGTLLALTRAESPSVFQVRAQDVTPAVLGSQVLAALCQQEGELARGALVVLDGARLRMRILPLRRRE
jgi:predicted nuclease of predicted toxin-antitoxin system